MFDTLPLMSVAIVVAEVEELTNGSIRFAQEISHATSGDRLGRIIRSTMKENSSAFRIVRAAVEERVDSLGGAGASLGLFMLAADMATTAAVGDGQLAGADRRELRRLWGDLRARGSEGCDTDCAAELIELSGGGLHSPLHSPGEDAG